MCSKENCSAIMVKLFQESIFSKVVKAVVVICFGQIQNSTFKIYYGTAVCGTYKFQGVCYFFRRIIYGISFFVSLALFVKNFKELVNYFRYTLFLFQSKFTFFHDENYTYYILLYLYIFFSAMNTTWISRDQTLDRYHLIFKSQYQKILILV